MKKSVKSMSFIIIIAMLLSSLFACEKTSNDPPTVDPAVTSDEESTAAVTEPAFDAELLEKIEDSTEQHYSKGYRQESLLKQRVEGTMSGNRAEFEYTAKTLDICVTTGNEGITTLMTQEVEQKTKSDIEDVTERYTVTKAYSDGTMYYGYKSDEKSTFLKSKIEMEDYVAHHAEYESGIEEPNYADVCEEITLELSDDKKTYIVTFAQSRKTESEVLNAFVNQLTEGFGTEFDLISFSYELIADAETLVVSEINVNIKTIYAEDNDELLHTYTMSATITSPQEDINTTPENAEGYVETGDLRYVDLVSEKLAKIPLSDNISLKYTGSTVYKYSSSEEQMYREETVVNAGVKNGVYVQHIKQKLKNYGSNEQNNVYVFNGIQQKIYLSSSVETSSDDMTEVGAKTFLAALLSNISLTPSDISSINVNKTPKGYAYVDFYLHFEKSDYDYLFTSLKTQATDGYIKIYAALDNTGRLMNAKYEFCVKSKYMGRDISIVTEYKIASIGEADLEDVTPVKPGSSEL